MLLEIDNLQVAYGAVRAVKGISLQVDQGQIVTLIGASVTMALEQGHPGSPLKTYGDALWWSATQMTTINSSLDPVSAWGRVMAVALRLYAVGFFSYLVANLASLFAAHFTTGDANPPHQDQTP